MINTIFAKKVEMTGKYDEKGNRIACSVLSVLPMTVLALRSKEKNGYTAAQIQIANNKSKTRREIRIDELPEVGAEIKFEEILKAGDAINVSGVTKGHGFAGVVKKYNFKGGPRTHGQSDRERAPGSSGATTTPGRVYKGKRRAGHMGVNNVLMRNLKVLEINPDKRLLIVAGVVPGGNGSTLLTVKKI